MIAAAALLSSAAGGGWPSLALVFGSGPAGRNFVAPQTTARFFSISIPLNVWPYRYATRLKKPANLASIHR
jgi:hypothetical protein